MAVFCLCCSREMLIARGNICRSCDENIKEKRRDQDRSDMIAETLGEFSPFAEGLKPAKFVRRDTSRRRVK